MIIYLYVKQHSITGLKYFGKTEQTNPFKYLGSGKRWKRHINKHGKEYIKTLEVWGFDNQELCTEFALKFSRENNIVESNEWANLKIEDGFQGGFPQSAYEKCTRFKNKKHNENTKKLYSEQRLGNNNGMFGRKHNDETKQKLKQKSAIRQLTRPKEELEKFSKCNLGKKQSKDHISKRTQNYKGRFAITNRNGVVRYTKDINDERLQSGEFIKGKIWSD